MPRLLRSPANARRFALHYAEMVVVMFAGMAVVGIPGVLALEAAGSGWDELAAGVQFILMCASMTVPMVAWMRFRGHGWRASGEMAGSMIVPTLVALALLPTGIDEHALMMGEHVAMPIAMLGVMLARPAEYVHAHHRHAAAA